MDRQRLEPIPVEHAPYLGGQLGEGKGLPDQVHPGVEAAMVDDGVRGVARGEQDRQPRPAPGHLVRERAPVHPSGENDIGEEELDLRMPLDDLQRPRAVASLEDTVSEIPQSLHGVRS